MTDNVVGFTGKRIAPTMEDEKEFRRGVALLVKDLKGKKVKGFAVAWIEDHEGNDQTYTRWVKYPGVGMHELIGAAYGLPHELYCSMPQIIEDDEP